MRSLHLTRPRAIMMVGVPGSGKSFFAEQFSRDFHTPYIDSEIISSLSTSKGGAARLIALVLTEITKTDQTFIIEGNSETKLLRSEFAHFAHERGYEPLFIWVQADRVTSRQRSAKKGRSKESYESAMNKFEAPVESEKALVVSGRHTYASQARAVLNYIGKDNRAGAPQHERPAAPIVLPPRKTNS